MQLVNQVRRPIGWRHDFDSVWNLIGLPSAPFSVSTLRKTQRTQGGFGCASLKNLRILLGGDDWRANQTGGVVRPVWNWNVHRLTLPQREVRLIGETIGKRWGVREDLSTIGEAKGFRTIYRAPGTYSPREDHLDE